jgi:hypothetical protein
MSTEYGALQMPLGKYTHPPRTLKPAVLKTIQNLKFIFHLNLPELAHSGTLKYPRWEVFLAFPSEYFGSSPGYCLLPGRRVSSASALCWVSRSPAWRGWCTAASAGPSPLPGPAGTVWRTGAPQASATGSASPAFTGQR